MDTASNKFESIKRYVELDARKARILQDFAGDAAASFDELVDDFYAAIDADREAREVITGGRQQVARLKGTLKQWLTSLMSGVYDQEYYERRSRIGHVHVRIGLPQRFMLTAMSRVRTQLHRVADEVCSDSVRVREVKNALNTVLDVELAIMLETYREDLAQQQRARERLATIGELAASVAHELRNPLGTVETSLFLMNQRLQTLEVSDSQIEKHRDKIARQVTHCSDTIARLLALTRDQPISVERGRLRELVDSTLEHLHTSKTTHFEVDIDPALEIDADPGQLGLLIANLVRNSEEAAPEGVTVAFSSARDGGGTVLFVTDDGPGVPESARHRLFDALFTTKANGTGLGMALAMRIVAAHHGEIRLENSDSGARFRIWLPTLEPS